MFTLAYWCLAFYCSCLVFSCCVVALLVGCTAIDLRFDYWFTVWVAGVGVLWRVGLGFVVAFGSVVFVCCG